MPTRTIDSFLRNLRRGVSRSFSKKTMKLAGELAVLQIVKRTRRGKGVSSTGGEEKPLKRLSRNYRLYRRDNRELLDQTASPNKSNLTFTGQLLRSMRVKKAFNKKALIGPNNRRRRGGLTNEKLGQYVTEQGRPFNFLSQKDIKKLEKLIDKILKQEMKRV